MLYNHLSDNERNLIDFLFNNQRLSISNIARKLKRSKSTISREIKRNTFNSEYLANKAIYLTKKRKVHKFFFRFRKYQEFTNLFLKIYEKRYHGVEVTVNKINSEYQNLLIVSTRQVFNWIRSNRWVIKKSDRLRKYYLKGRKRKDGFYSKFNNKFVLPIWVRPKNIDLRLEYGHWEADLIIGKRSSGFSNVLTLVERKTRMSYGVIVNSKNPMKINSALFKLIKQNKLEVKTITIGNGIEFEKIGILAYWLKCKIYFCEPYASYQRGSNENVNGLIRRTFKKGTNFSEISDFELQEVITKINFMPRKIFNWKSSAEIKEMNH